MPTRDHQLHQTIHGYNDGHRLLQTSRKLPPNVERLMLVISDMSGSSMVHGFESYLTGYPLSEIKAYALARTWYAPEMERPGCVWTHTLIIQNIDLAYIVNLWVLRDLFARPERSSKSWELYSRTLTLSPDEYARQARQLKKPRVDPALSGLVRNALAALYGSPQSQVFLPAESTSTEYEQLSVALWSQQWARLRRGFSFCTGSIADRKLPGGVFDWQIIPRSSAREIKRDLKNAVFIDTTSESKPAVLSAWLETAVQDLCSPRPLGLRAFLRNFGIETSHGRADFAPLVQVFADLGRLRKEGQPLGELTRAVARLFPTSSEGERLKSALYGTRTAGVKTPTLLPQQRFLNSISEADVLRELSTTEHHEVFDPEKLEIAERALALVKADFKSADEIAYALLNHELTPLGEKFIDGFCEGITSSDVFEFRYEQLEIIYSLLERKPSLAASPKLWRGNDREQRNIFDFVHRRLRLGQEGISRLVAAMLEAGTDAVARELEYAYPMITVETVLGWCESLPVDEVLNLNIGWKQVLAHQPEICIKWLQRNQQRSDAAATLLAAVLDPHSWAVRNGGARLWIDFGRRAPFVLSGESLTPTICFLLALGFNNPDDEAVNLVIETFEPTHRAAGENLLDEANWRILAQQAPPIMWDGEWDKCERLRGALMDCFIRFRWSQEDFLRCLKNPVLLEKVIDQVLTRDTWFNKKLKYLEKVAKKAVAGEIEAAQSQRNVLARYFDN